jgi:serine/threonine protein kinase
MGLARFNTPSILSDTSGTLTREGSVLGTFDYLAPEQAKNSREVDARADLYSLGCTFYHLIGGKPPFPDGPGLDKLIRHQTEEPPRLSSLRPDVPAGVAALIHKLMAKRPEDRYASGKEVAEAVRELGLVETMPAPDALLLDEVLPVLEADASTVVQQPSSPKTTLPHSRRKPPTRIHTPRLKSRRARGLPKFVWLLAGGGAGMAALIFLILLLAVLASKGPKAPGAVPTESAARPVTTSLKK